MDLGNESKLKKGKRHKFYFTDTRGGFSGYDKQTVYIDFPTSTLCVGHKLKIPLAEIRAVELRPLANDPSTSFLAIEVCGPAIGDGSPTTLRLIHKDFFMRTKERAMQDFVEEITPLISGNTTVEIPNLVQISKTGSMIQASYVLNFSLLIGFYRKQWYNYDSRRMMVFKTLFLMLWGGCINTFGILLFLVPIDNYTMSRNLVAVGWSRKSAMIAYLLLSYPAYAYWAFCIFGHSKNPP